MNNTVERVLDADFFGIATFLVILFAVGLLLAVISYASQRQKTRTRDRLVELTESFAVSDEKVDQEDVFRRRTDGVQDVGDEGTFSRALDLWLAPAGGIKSLPAIAISGVVVGLLLYVILGIYLQIPATITAGFALIASIAAPIWYVRHLDTKFKQSFLEHFPDAIDMVVRAIKAGIPVTEAIAAAGNEVSSPVREEFQQIAEEIGIGESPDTALNRAAQRIALADFKFFAVTLVIQRETGGHLAQTLENLSGLLRRRKEMRKKIRALTAEGRVTAKMIGGLPFVMFLLFYVVEREYIMKLFIEPMGKYFLLAALVMLSIGMYVVTKMAKMKV